MNNIHSKVHPPFHSIHRTENKHHVTTTGNTTGTHHLPTTGNTINTHHVTTTENTTITPRDYNRKHNNTHHVTTTWNKHITIVLTGMDFWMLSAQLLLPFSYVACCSWRFCPSHELFCTTGSRLTNCSMVGPILLTIDWLIDCFTAHQYRKAISAKKRC